jgi:hypothetical protein
MHQYLHIVTDTERIIDPDGQEFGDLEMAKQEAVQSARDLMAEELRNGRPIPLNWRVQIAEADGTIRATIKFAELVFGEGVSMPTARRTRDPDLIARAKATMHKADQGQKQIQQGLEQLRRHVQTLSQLSAILPRTRQWLAGRRLIKSRWDFGLIWLETVVPS